jgi:small-conductance mechanosensitive channel
MQKKRISFILIIFFLAETFCLQGQEVVSMLLKDTTKSFSETINISEISQKSAELTNKTKQKIRELISDQSIIQLEIKNEVILSSINPSLTASLDPSDVSINIRFLENRRLKLLYEQQKIINHQSELSEIYRSLDDFKNMLARETKRWKKTKEMLAQDSLTLSIPIKLSETISFLDTTLALISYKSDPVLSILDKTIAVRGEVELQIEKTKALIKSKEHQFLADDHVNYFQLNFGEDQRKEIKKSIMDLNRSDLAELTEYLNYHKNLLILSLLILLGLIYLFVIIRKKVKLKEKGYGYFYKDILFKVLSHPFNASVVLTLVFTTIIFPDRPYVFREFSGYLIALPLLNILKLLLDKKYYIYINAFGIIIIFYMLLGLFPTTSIIYRNIFLLISIAEISLLTLFLIRFVKKNNFAERYQGVVYFFVILHLGLAVTGFFSNLAGRLILTEIALSAVFVNIFKGLIALISVLLINGLIATIIDMKYGQKLNVFRLYGELIKRKTIPLFNFIAALLWITNILQSFRLKDKLFNGISSFFSSKITIGSASFSLNNILIFFLVIYFSILISKIIRTLLEEDILNRISMSKGLPHTIAMVVRYSLITSGFFLAVAAAGIPLDKLTIILGAFGVGIGFGLQNIFNNLISGLILLFERPIQLGDTVQVGQLTGNVKSIGIRSSNVRTFDGAEVIVPNGQLVSNEVINWTLSDQRRRIEINFGVSYNSDPKFVHLLLVDILVKHLDVLHDPEPLVFFSGLGESSLDFSLLFWIGDYAEGRRIKSEILFMVFEVMKENQIEIPFPQRDLHLRSIDPGIVFRNNGVEN